jgi:hypothetical protein
MHHDHDNDNDNETSQHAREKIFNSILEVKNKDNNTSIPISKKHLVYENSKYSSTKNNIWHLYINDNKITKKTNYVFFYKCLNCYNINSCGATQILRKIRQCKSQCFQCNNINLNSKDFPAKVKREVLSRSLREIFENSKNEFETFPDTYKNSYLLSHLSEKDYERIRTNILSFCNGKQCVVENYEYWPIYKVNNQMKFSYVIYDKVNNTIFKANQPIMKCDNCEKSWRCKSLETFKNCYKVLCPDCKLCNRTFKIRPIKNMNNQIITYQSKLELKFIEWCASKNIIVTNGPSIDYTFKNKPHKYRVDFQIKDILIEIKDFHIWHRNQIESGLWDVKMNAVDKYIIDNGLKKYFFVTPNNWKQMMKEIINITKH